jgi:hypothetical protein
MGTEATRQRGNNEGAGLRQTVFKWSQRYNLSGLLKALKPLSKRQLNHSKCQAGPLSYVCDLAHSSD